jgi:hypothetical protein
VEVVEGQQTLLAVEQLLAVWEEVALLVAEAEVPELLLVVALLLRLVLGGQEYTQEGLGLLLQEPL